MREQGKSLLRAEGSGIMRRELDSLPNRRAAIEEGLDVGTTKQGVASVERALSILAAFQDGEVSLSLSALAARTKLYKSTILRLVGSLETFGYIRRLETGQYQLGPALCRLGILYRQSFRLDDFVLPVIRTLSRETEESSSFYVREGASRLCLFRVDSMQVVRDHVQVGDLLPLESGAGGRVLMTFARGKMARERCSPEFVVATSGERQPDTAAVAAPIFGREGELVGALSVSGPRTRFSKPVVARIAARVLEHAKALTTSLGGDASVYPTRAIL